MPLPHPPPTQARAEADDVLGRPVRARAGVPRLEWLLEGRGAWIPRLASDVAALALAIAIAHPHDLLGDAGLGLLLLLPFSPVAIGLRGLYGRQVGASAFHRLGTMVGALAAAGIAVVVVTTLLVGETGKPFVTGWLIAAVAICAGRAVIAATLRWARASGRISRPTLIVGAGVIGTQIARRLLGDPQYGMRPIGFVDDPSMGAVGAPEARFLPTLGGFGDLPEIVAQSGARHVIIAFSGAARDSELMPLVHQCESLKVQVSLVPRMFESINDRLTYETLGGLPLMRLRPIDTKGWQFAVKHALDIVGALAMLIAAAPVMLAIAVLIRLESPGPALFRQVRVGRDGQVFDLLKFRSMRVEPEGGGEFRLPDGSAPGGVEGVDRRTRVGRFLRRTSLDELPQLFNVLRGEMSLIGPRPERPEFVEVFGRDVRRYGDRHRVRSGLTGWAQVHGLRGQTSLHDRVEWDNYYIEHWSLGLDMRILLMTVAALMRDAE